MASPNFQLAHHRPESPLNGILARQPNPSLVPYQWRVTLPKRSLRGCLVSFCRETGENVKRRPKYCIDWVSLFQLYR